MVSFFVHWRDPAFLPYVTRGTMISTMFGNINYTRPIVFLNGVFDVLHPGHFALIEYAHMRVADDPYVIVAANSDQSARRLKGVNRPYIDLKNRLKCLNMVRGVDLAVGFEEDTPEELIHHLRPIFLVKGAEYRGKKVPGDDLVSVAFAPMHGDFHTSTLMSRSVL